MQKPSWIAIATGLIALTLAVPSSAAFIGGGVNANVEKIASNVFETAAGAPPVYMVEGTKEWGGSNGGHAISNCQAAVPVDTIIINIVVGNTLDLGGGLATLGRNGGGDWKSPYANPAANAMCEQDIGTIIVSREAAPDWGAPAAQPTGLTGAVGQAWGGASIAGAPKNGVGGSGTTGGVSVVSSNYAHIYLGGGAQANSISNCQILVAWNTVVVNVGVDIGSVFGRVPIEDGPIQLSKAEPTNTVSPNGEAAKGATSSCKQTVKLIELIDGDGFIPPSS